MMNTENRPTPFYFRWLAGPLISFQALMTAGRRLRFAEGRLATRSVAANATFLLVMSVGILNMPAITPAHAQFDDLFLDDFQVVPNRVVLSQPILGASVTAYRLSDLNTPIEGPVETRPGRRHRAGGFELDLPGVADDEWVLLVATGGAEMAPSDRPHQGPLRALARASDWRAQGQTINLLTELAWQAVQTSADLTDAEDVDQILRWASGRLLSERLGGQATVSNLDLLAFDAGRAIPRAALQIGYSAMSDIEQAVLDGNGADFAAAVEVFFPGGFAPPPEPAFEAANPIVILPDNELGLVPEDLEVASFGIDNLATSTNYSTLLTARIPGDANVLLGYAFPDMARQQALPEAGRSRATLDRLANRQQPELSPESTAAALGLMFIGGGLDTAEQAQAMALILDHADFAVLATDLSGLIAADPKLLSRLDQYEQLVDRISSLSESVLQELWPEDVDTFLAQRNLGKTFDVGSPWRPDQPWDWYEQGLGATAPPFPAVRTNHRRGLAIGNPTYLNYSMHIYDAQGQFYNWVLSPRVSSVREKDRMGGAVRRDLTLGGQVPNGARFVQFHKYRFTVDGFDRGQIPVTLLNELNLMEAIMSVQTPEVSVLLEEVIAGFDPDTFRVWLDGPSGQQCLPVLDELSGTTFNSSGNLAARLDSLLQPEFLEVWVRLITDCNIPYFNSEGQVVLANYLQYAIVAKLVDFATGFWTGGKAPLIMAIINRLDNAGNKAFPVVASYLAPSGVATYQLIWFSTPAGPAIASAIPVPEMSPPTADFTHQFQSQTQVSFDGSPSLSAPGRTLTYSWQFGDGQTANGQQVTHTYSAAGTYDVQLQVTDSEGRTDSLIRRITVSASGRPPVIESLECSIQSTSPVEIEMTATVTDPDGDLQSLAWYRSPSTSTPAAVTAPGTQTQVLTYAQSQSIYSPVLTATDQAGNATSRVCTVGGGGTPGPGITGFIRTENRYAFDADPNQACQAEFGASYRVADWLEVKSYYDSGASMDIFFAETGMTADDRSGGVKRDGEQFYTSGRSYFVSRHDGVLPPGWLAHDQLGGYLISLGSWYTDRKILCKQI